MGKRKGAARLRISYLGGGYDFPKFFAHQPIHILSEAIAIEIACIATDVGVRWHTPGRLGRGLGSSAAKSLAFLRAKYPNACPKKQMDTAIQLESLQCGGWQDPIASGQDGLIHITLYKDTWQVEKIEGKGPQLLKTYRRLYEIPGPSLDSTQRASTPMTSILTEMQNQADGLKQMQALVRQGSRALARADFSDFGKTVLAAWQIKKMWHPRISTPTIEQMCAAAKAAGAWGYKVCGSGGQGYLLVLGPEPCHARLAEDWSCFEVDHDVV